MFEVNGWCKYGEQDHYETGCDPDEYVSFSGNERWSADNIPALITKLRDFVGVDEDYEIELDACEEDGRVDICVMENAESFTADAWDIEQWKKGKLALWYSTYTFMVERVVREPVRLVEV